MNHEPAKELSTHAGRMLALLAGRCTRGDGPMVARDIAVELSLWQDTTAENQKRKVRDLALEIKDALVSLCASIVDGYWLARSPDDWRDYQECERRNAVYRFARHARIREQVRDQHAGQGKLFGEQTNTECFSR